MWVNNNATSSRGVEFRDGSTRTVLKVFMPYIPATDLYYDRYAVWYGYGQIIEVRNLAKDVMEKHMKWLNKLYE
jgi:hypothetical protein